MSFFINLFFLAAFLPINITFFNLKLKNYKFAFSCFILGVFLSTIIERNISNLSWLILPFSLLCITATAYFMFESTIRTILLSQLSSYFVISLLNQLVRFVFAQLPIKFSIDTPLSSLLQSLIVFLLVFSFSFFVYTKRIFENKFTITYLIFFTSIIAIDCTVVIVIGYLLFNRIYNINVPLTLIIYLLLILGILIQIILLIHMIKSRDLHKENERLARQYLENQTRYYEYLVQREEDTRKFRHDIRNHISMLNMLFQESKIDECRDYLQDLTAHYENIHNAISVNNCIADAILNKYYYEAQNHGIELTVTGHFPSECNLPAYDICTVFSNLLENALKAVIDCGGKDISVGCRYTDTEILLSIENDSDYVELDADGMPRTSKNDVSQHGFGLKNVQQCVRQNNGHMSIQTNDKRFKVILSLSRGNDNESCNNR